MAASTGVCRHTSKASEITRMPDRIKPSAVRRENRAGRTSGSATEEFVSAMRVATTGVNLITTDGPAGRFGLTVSAMCSVSAEPPMLLACINRKSPVCSAICLNQVFCVNVLSIRQHRLASTFAGMAQSGKAYDFDATQWRRGVTDAPRLSDAIAAFDCLLENAYAAGTHYIFVGRVAAATSHDATPLLYTNRRYGFPCPPIRSSNRLIL